MTGDIQEINLAQLRTEYVDNRRHVVAAARRLLRPSSKSMEALMWELRHHDEEGITDEETWFRDGVDYLLAFFSVAEIGAATGHLPAYPNTESRQWALIMLDNPAVRMYYEHRYPLKLPMLYRSRLMGAPWVQARELVDARQSFTTFLEITRPIENDQDLESFLWFLDGGARVDRRENKWVDIDDTRRVLRKPKQFVNALSSSPKSRGALRRSVVGFGKFLQFCNEFERLLIEVQDQPLLQAYYWHYHAYWFAHAAERLRKEIPRAIDEFAKWKGSTSQARRDYKRDSVAMKKTVRRLTSAKYGKTMPEARPREWTGVAVAGVGEAEAEQTTPATPKSAQ